ncbi:MAG: hypothetical protein ACKVU4_11610 [Phycisphaerales bacterium]
MCTSAPKSPPPQWCPRRGTILVAFLILLVLMSLVVVGLVLSGARGHELTVLRAQGDRATHAAESAANMAVKELMDGVDRDGDGTIGAISDDGNTATDPVLGGTRLWATRADSGGVTTITARAQNADAVRATRITSTQSGQASGVGVVYGTPTSNTPVFRTWNGSAWSAETPTADIGANPRWIVTAACPVRNELLAACGDTAEDLNVMVYDGTTWGSAQELSNNLVTSGDRPFYAAYSQVSGTALVVYRVGGGANANHRTWNGMAWSGQQSTALPGTGSPKIVKLVPKPGADEIMVLVLDNNNDLSAMVWNGTAFGNTLLLDANAAFSGQECADAAYERSSGRCMVAWARGGTTVPRCRVWTGSAWQTESAMPDAGANVKQMRLAADPASDKVIAMTLDSAADVNLIVWNGSSWGPADEVQSSVPNSDRRGVDVAFEPGGTRALAMYARSSQSTVRYRVYDGTNWSAEMVGPDISHPISVVQFMPAATGSEILIGIERKNDGAFVFMRWNGSALVGAQTLAGDLAGPNGNECFMLSRGSEALNPAITSWSAVEP